jgi:hypothetical protein
MAVWLFRDAALDPGERIVFRRGANLLRGRRRVGGEVTVTDRRLLFLANRLEHLVGAGDESVPLAAVLDVTVVPARTRPELLRGVPPAPRARAEVDTSTGPLLLSLEDADAEALARVLADVGDPRRG